MHFILVRLFNFVCLLKLGKAIDFRNRHLFEIENYQFFGEKTRNLLNKIDEAHPNSGQILSKKKIFF